MTCSMVGVSGMMVGAQSQQAHVALRHNSSPSRPACGSAVVSARFD